MRALFRAVAGLASRAPWALLAGNLAVLAVAVAASLGAPDDLGIGSTRLDQDEQEEELAVVIEGAAGDSRVFEVARQVIAAQVEADPGVVAVRSEQAADGAEAAVLFADTGDASEAERQEVLVRLGERIDPGPLDVAIGGETAVAAEAREELGGDLWRLELLVLPLVLLLAAVVLGPRLLPAAVIAASTAVAGTLATMRLVGLFADVSLLGVVPALVIGAALGLELPSLLRRLYRDERVLSEPDDALSHALETGGRWLSAAAVLAALPAFGLLVTPLDQAPSLILGCAVAAVLAAASAVVSSAALVSLWPDPSDPESEPGRLAEALRSVPRWLAGRRLATAGCLLLAIGGALAVAWPALDGTSRALLAADLEPGAEAARAAQLAGLPAADGGSLFPDLPLAAAVGAGALAVGLLVVRRRPIAVLVAAAALLPAAAGIGATVFVFQDGHFGDVVDLDVGPVQTAAVACAAAALSAVAAARSALGLAAVRAERRLGIAPDGAAELAGALLLPGLTAGTLAGALVAGALLGADLEVARQFGLAVVVGLLVDLVLRVPLLATIARWG